MSKKLLIAIVTTAFVLAVSVTTVVAAPMMSGTKLSVVMGTDAAFNFPCTVGSCFSMEVSPGQDTWINFGPGTDGGFILGKDQVSGGQELAPSSANTTPGELSSEWSYFSNWGTFTTTSYPAEGYTVGSSDNLFDDAGCTLSGCIGKTELNAWYVCWNAAIYAMGSGYTCVHSSCSTAQQNSISIEYYTIDPVDDGDWSIYHKWVVPSNPPSSFAGVKFGVIMRGKVTLSPCVDCDDSDACTADSCDVDTSTCINAAISCDDSNVCTDETDDACEPATGCVYTNNTLACVDGDACTSGDVCSGGSCSGTAIDACLNPIYPVDGQTGLGSEVEFKWNKVPGAVSYDLYNCAEDPTVSCDSVTVTAKVNNNGIFYAGGGGLLLIGMTFIGGLRGRKMLALLLITGVMFAGGAIMSCSNSPKAITEDPATDEVQHFASELSGNTTYYWKVTADDGLGSTSTTTTLSYTTL